MPSLRQPVSPNCDVTSVQREADVAFRVRRLESRTNRDGKL